MGHGPPATIPLDRTTDAQTDGQIAGQIAGQFAAQIDGQPDRRRFPREAMDLAVKLLHVQGARFIGGRTMDASPLGLLIELDEPRPILAGDRVRIAIGSALVRSESLTPGRVVRVERTTSGAQRVGVALDHAIELKPAGSRAASRAA